MSNHDDQDPFGQMISWAITLIILGSGILGIMFLVF